MAAPPPEPLLVLRGHRAAVQCVAFLPDCSALAAGDGEGELKLWSLDTRREASSIRAHESHAGILQVACPCATSSSAASPDIISQGRNGVVKCWQLQSGSSISSQPLQVLSAGSYNFCRFALLQPGQSSSSCAVAPSVVTAAVPAAGAGSSQPAVQGFQLAAAAASASATLGSASDKQQQPAGLLSQQLQQQQQHGSGLEAAVSSLDLGQEQQLAQQLEEEQGDLTEEAEEQLVNASSAAAPAASPGPASSSGARSGALLVALPAADAAHVGVWQLGQSGGAEQAPQVLLEQQKTSERPSHGLCMAVVLLQPEGRSLHALCGYEDGSVALWDARQPARCITSAKLHSEAVMCLAAAPGCTSGFSGAADDSLAAFDLDVAAGLLRLGKRLALPSPGVAEVAVRPDGRIAASAGWDGKLRVWHARKRLPLAVLRWHAQQVAAVSFSSDSQLLAAGSRDNHISIWSLFT